MEEILQSGVFSVNPFNDEISALIKKRKALIAEGKIEEAKVVAKQLCDINPEYFSFMDPNINF